MHLLSVWRKRGRPSLGNGTSDAHVRLCRRWATNLGGGNTQNGRDSNAKRLGIKLGNGATVLRNQIVVRQRGFQYWPGGNIYVGKDHTLNSKCDGVVHFSKDYDTKRTYVNVIPRAQNPLPNPHPRGFTLTNITAAVPFTAR